MELVLLKIVINHNPKIQHKKVKFSQRKWSRGLSFAWRPKIKTRYSWEATFKSNHAKGWCGPGWVRSSGDFDGLDALGLCFLKPKVHPISHSALEQKKYNIKRPESLSSCLSNRGNQPHEHKHKCVEIKHISADALCNNIQWKQNSFICS